MDDIQCNKTCDLISLRCSIQELTRVLHPLCAWPTKWTELTEPTKNPMDPSWVRIWIPSISKVDN